ncbi:hypothetical protein A6X21_15075 [Planctopirus hydrillae]|uniref:Uncharacterized protein n=1 Tax=Planctopirus hydrillae TaxID=1841610 RepID=A0A1C3E3P6_9PLAN|nr:hypothetical protein A6X21_15075 [Planctopirus hydrillae]
MKNENLLRVKSVAKRLLQPLGPLAGIVLAGLLFAMSATWRESLAYVQVWVAPMLWLGLTIVVWWSIRRIDPWNAIRSAKSRPGHSEDMLAHGCKQGTQHGMQRFLGAWLKAVAMGALPMLVPAIVMTILLIPLAEAWVRPSPHGSLIGGILPWSDASGYYQGAVELLEGEKISSWPSRRPVNSAWLAVRHSMGGSWESAILLQTMLLAMSWCVMDRTFQIAGFHFGVRYASFVMVERFAFESTPTMLSEPLGLVLGMLAIPWIVPAVQAGLKPGSMGVCYAIGSGILALGLSARPGAMFVLVGQALWPLVLLFPGWSWVRSRLKVGAGKQTLHRHEAGLTVPHGAHPAAMVTHESSKPKAWVMIGTSAGALLAMLLALSIQPLLNGWYGPGYSVGQGSFAHTWYGLVTGQPGWNRVLIEHPEVRELPDDRAQVTRIYQLADDAFREQPWGLLIGYLRGWQISGKWIVFSIIDWMKLPSRWLGLIIVLGVGLWLLWKARIRPLDKLSIYLLLQTAATIASLPFFLPDTGIRGLAATWPLCLLMAFQGLLPSRLALKAIHADKGEGPVVAQMSEHRHPQFTGPWLVSSGFVIFISASSLIWPRFWSDGQEGTKPVVSVRVFDPERLPEFVSGSAFKKEFSPRWITSQQLVDTWPEPVPDELIDALLLHPVWELKVQLARKVADPARTEPELEWELFPMALVNVGGSTLYGTRNIRSREEQRVMVRGLNHVLLVRLPDEG